MFNRYTLESIDNVGETMMRKCGEKSPDVYELEYTIHRSLLKPDAIKRLLMFANKNWTAPSKSSLYMNIMVDEYRLTINGVNAINRTLASNNPENVILVTLGNNDVHNTSMMQKIIIPSALYKSDDYYFTIRAAIERPFNIDSASDDFHSSIASNMIPYSNRLIERMTFNVARTPIYTINLDISYVKSSTNIATLNRASYENEVEIELSFDKSKFTHAEFVKANDQMKTTIQQVLSVLHNSKTFNTLFETKQLISNISLIIDNKNMWNLLPSLSFLNQDQYVNDIHVEQFTTFVFTRDKILIFIDDKRMNLIVNENQSVYIESKTQHINELCKKYANTVLLAEYDEAKNIYWIEDILILNGSAVRNGDNSIINMKTRHEELSKIAAILQHSAASYNKQLTSGEMISRFHTSELSKYTEDLDRIIAKRTAGDALVIVKYIIPCYNIYVKTSNKNSDMYGDKTELYRAANMILSMNKVLGNVKGGILFISLLHKNSPTNEIGHLHWFPNLYLDLSVKINLSEVYERSKKLVTVGEVLYQTVVNNFNKLTEYTRDGKKVLLNIPMKNSSFPVALNGFIVQDKDIVRVEMVDNEFVPLFTVTKRQPDSQNTINTYNLALLNPLTVENISLLANVRGDEYWKTIMSIRQSSRTVNGQIFRSENAVDALINQSVSTILQNYSLPVDNKAINVLDIDRRKENSNLKLFLSMHANQVIHLVPDEEYASHRQSMIQQLGITTIPNHPLITKHLNPTQLKKKTSAKIVVGSLSSGSLPSPEQYQLMTNVFNVGECFASSDNLDYFLRNINKHLSSNGTVVLIDYDGKQLLEKFENDGSVLTFSPVTGEFNKSIKFTKHFTKNRTDSFTGMKFEVNHSIGEHPFTHDSYLVNSNFLTQMLKTHCSLKLIETGNMYDVSEIDYMMLKNLKSSESDRYYDESLMRFIPQEIIVNSSTRDLLKMIRYWVYRKSAVSETKPGIITM